MATVLDYLHAGYIIGDGMEGQVLGHCRLQKKIGEGGMGAVYLARHEVLDKDVAVKILPSGQAANPEFVERFLREARSAARLEHPNVVPVLDAGSQDKSHFIVMQYVDGTDLQKLINKRGKISLRDALSITKKVAQALSAAHALGIVHRDIKPSNILINKQGKVLVSDFGLARDLKAGATLTSADQIVGTPHYISPEQARGEKVTVVSDIYSLGAMLYCMLTGKPPYTGPSAMSILVKHVNKEDRPEPLSKVEPSVPKNVEALVDRMMEKEASKRLQGADEVVAEIDRLKGGPTMVGVMEDRILTPHRKRRLLFAGAGAGVAGLILLVIILGMLFGKKPGEKALRRAENEKDSKLALTLYERVIESYPDTEWARKADAAAREIRRDLLGVELKRIEAEAAKEGSHGRDIVRGVEEARKDWPWAAAELDRLEARLHRERVIRRSRQVLGLAQKQDFDALVRYMDPVIIREKGEDAAKFGVRLAFGIGSVAGLRLESCDIDEQGITLVPRKEARIPFTITIHNERADKKATHEDELYWAWVEGDWYIRKDPEKPDKRPPKRDPRRDGRLPGPGRDR